MTNSFYNPSGNPGTGAQGLSAAMRAEFLAISAAFDVMPQIGTTGVFQTIFAQQGSYTFTLPGAAGTLAMLSDVASDVTVETTRAKAAETVLTTAVGAEMTRATAAEGVLSSAVATETVRAEAAEAVVAGALGVETTRAEAAESVLTAAIPTAVAAEATARTTAIGVETTRATAAEALRAPLASPALTGVPTAPTASPGTNTTQLATTAFNTAAVAVETARATTAEALLAPKASPAFTGTVSGVAGSFSGAVGVNTFTAAVGGSSIGFTGNNGLYLNQTGLTAGSGIVINMPLVTSNFIAFTTATVQIGSITMNGPGTATLFNTTSDYRLKRLYGPADAALLRNLPIYDGCFAAAPDHRQPMAVAHEIAEVAPWAVTGHKDAVDEDGRPVMQQVDYSALVPALIAYVQSLERRLASIEAQ